MELAAMLSLMLLAAAFLCSGNLCIIASKVGGLEPYSSVTVTFLIEVLKLSAMLAAIAVTQPPPPEKLKLRKSCYYAVPALLSVLESNLNYVVLRYLDAATVSVLWNLKILLTAVLFRYVLKQRLSELHKVAIVLLILGVLTSQSDRFRHFGGPENGDKLQHLTLGLLLALVGVTLSSCASVFTEWTLKRQADCSFLWQSVQMYGFGVLFNALGLLLDGKLLAADGFFHGYSGWTVAVLVVNSIGGIFMACILKYLDNIACVYSHSMAMMLTTVLSMIFFAFSPSLEFACGLGVLVLSMYLYHHPLAQVAVEKEASPSSDTSTEDEHAPSPVAPSLQLKRLDKYKEVPDAEQERGSSSINITEV
ncbi:CMP-sialic acid transporter 1 [Phytophthora ramorum]|uniref:CMP-sialic acid transporter 1 n=1 Tax=Phytophthora ramorum TaxID=164328 RepID=UPI0030B64766|nr:CMP-sialic acid transporter 1 [Phytophthora ramorum]